MTHGWSWDNENYLFTVSAMSDRLPLKWLYWIEEHIPIIGTTGLLEGNSIEFILSEEEAMTTKIIFYGENDESIILYEPGSIYTEKKVDWTRPRDMSFRLKQNN